MIILTHAGTGGAGSAIASPIFLEIAKILSFSTPQHFYMKGMCIKKSHKHTQHFLLSGTPVTVGNLVAFFNSALKSLQKKSLEKLALKMFFKSLENKVVKKLVKLLA